MMTSKYDGLIIVEKEYLEELEAFKKSKAYLPNLSDIKLEYKDIVRIDTYKDSFIKYLEQTRVSIANQRALNIGQEKELMGAIDALSDMIKNVSKI
jgi:hypothetical protein